MKVILFLLCGLFCIPDLSAQDSLPFEPSPSYYCWFNEHEPVPLNLDSIKNAISHPGVAQGGKLIVRILLDVNGYYVKHVVLKTPDERWTAAIEAVLPMLRCTPPIVGGKPASCWITIPFSIR